MKPTAHRSLILFAAILVLRTGAVADVVNDGTTAANLTLLGNTNAVGSAVATLTPDGAGGLVAAQAGASGGQMALRSAWFASGSIATSGVYSVSAEFSPFDTFQEYVGGVIGWLDPATRRGLALFVAPGDRFYVKHIDFSATTGAGNETLANVFNLDGSAATEDTTSAASTLGDYDPERPATFELAFAAPGPSDLVALSNATARVTARVLQSPVGGGTPTLLGRAMELLLDLQQPSTNNHRFGYFGYWGLAGFDGTTIGTFDNLTATNVSVATEPPTAPKLTIVLNGANVEVSWPTEYNTFHLESSPTLGPATWTTLPTSNNRYTTNAIGGPVFFRLAQ